MYKYKTNFLKFPPLKDKEIIVNFNGGSISSDGGVALLKEVERKTNLLAKVAKVILDKRDPRKRKHSVLAMLKQLVFGIACGYEDLNDHNILRTDDAFRACVGSDGPLASGPTLCRLENSIEREDIIAIHKLLADHFIESYEHPPKSIVLDFDATDIPIHGNQEGRHYNAYYRNYCFLPLYVFCGKHLLVAYLQPSNQDPAKHAGAILKLLVQRIRQSWPHVEIIIRADSGFCRQRILNWCDKNNVKYIIGIARNNRLEKLLEPLMNKAKETYKATSKKQVLFTKFSYAAGSWKGKKTVIGKADYSKKGANPRFVVTNIDGDPQELYQKIYCARGDMENRIKEQKLDLHACRTSCHKWWPNQFRLILSALAYIFIQYLADVALVDTPLKRAQPNTIRLKLLKVGTRIKIKGQLIIFSFSSHYPWWHIFKSAYMALVPP